VSSLIEDFSESEEALSKLSLIYASLLTASGSCASYSSRYLSPSTQEEESSQRAREHLSKARDLYLKHTNLTTKDQQKYELVSRMLTEGEATEETTEKKKKLMRRKKKGKETAREESDGKRRRRRTAGEL
jgi:DNA topoisomerase VI subunit B